MRNFLVLAIVVGVGACAPPATDEQPQVQEVAEDFMESMVKNLGPGKEREELEQGLESGKIQPLQMHAFGAVICSSLNRGLSKEDILDGSYYHFWGAPVSDAMYEAALEVLCPELSATSPGKLQQ